VTAERLGATPRKLEELGRGVDENDELVTCASRFEPAFIEPITNNFTEFLAMLHALEAMGEGWSGYVYCDSMLTLGRFFQGWKNKNIPDEFIVRAQLAVKRLGKITPVHISGHPTKKDLVKGMTKSGRPVSKWNEYVDKLCTEAGVNR
jgi:hypothetical protein